MADPTELLPPTPVNTPPAGPSKVTCEYCECHLTARGEVLKFSEKAKGFRDHEDVLAKRDKRIAELETELADYKRKVAELTPAERKRFDLDF